MTKNEIWVPVPTPNEAAKDGISDRGFRKEATGYPGTGMVMVLSQWGAPTQYDITRLR